MKGILAIAFGVGALWDGYTTVIGLSAILKANSNSTWTLCFVGALLVAALMLSTPQIWTNSRAKLGFLKPFWLCALLFDFYSSLRGTLDVISSQGTTTTEQWVTVVAITLFVCASPIALGIMMDDD